MGAETEPCAVRESKGEEVTMATFPDGVRVFREKENLPGVVFDPNNKKTLYADDMIALEEEVRAVEATLLTPAGRRMPIVGTGFPNGVVTAPVGAKYIDTNITNGVSSWIKKSGSGNTGWEVLEGRVGSSIPQSDLLNGWNYELQASAMRLYREGRVVTCLIPAIGLRGTSATSNLFYQLPLGYRVAPAGNYGTLGFINRNGQPVRITKDFSNIATQTGANVDGIVSWVTNDPWPVSVPGTQV